MKWWWNNDVWRCFHTCSPWGLIFVKACEEHLGLNFACCADMKQEDWKDFLLASAGNGSARKDLEKLLQKPELVDSNFLDVRCKAFRVFLLFCSEVFILLSWTAKQIIRDVLLFILLHSGCSLFHGPGIINPVRADCLAYESYQLDKLERIHSPITTFRGGRDVITSPSVLRLRHHCSTTAVQVDRCISCVFMMYFMYFICSCHISFQFLHNWCESQGYQIVDACSRQQIWAQGVWGVWSYAGQRVSQFAGRVLWRACNSRLFSWVEAFPDLPNCLQINAHFSFSGLFTG